MLIIITPEEILKFPTGRYDGEVLIEKAPFSFNLLAQNMNDYSCCGLIEGDEKAFRQSEIEFEEVTDIPSGYEQRVFKYDRYGKYLNMAEITRYMKIENDSIPKLEQENEMLMMALAELDMQRETDKTESELAIAELAETVLGGV